MKNSRIVCAAIRFHEGHIVCGPRHFDKTMNKQIHCMNNEAKRYPEQGFVDQFGEFYNRVDALAVVKAIGQPFDQERNVSKTELFSEGLY